MKLLASVACAMLALTSLGTWARLVETQTDVHVAVKDTYNKLAERDIKVTFFVDDKTPAPRPLIVINHGRAVTAQERADLGRVRFTEASKYFARLGFLVAVPTRVGYGVTGGDDVEDSGACESKRYPAGYLAAAQQTQAVIEAVVASRSDVLRDRTVVLGQSYGGTTAATVASLNLPGVVAAINFAGGGGGNPKTQPRRPCSSVQLERMFRDYGKTARTPMLWVYTENDLYFGAEYPREWFKAYQAHGAPAQMVQFEPHGEDGHKLFTSFPAVWQPVVHEFLRQQGFNLEARP